MEKEVRLKYLYKPLNSLIVAVGNGGCTLMICESEIREKVLAS